jgi:hypothetical protein
MREIGRTFTFPVKEWSIRNNLIVDWGVPSILTRLLPHDIPMCPKEMHSLKKKINKKPLGGLMIHEPKF